MKYFEAMKVSFKAQLAWRFDIYMTLLMSVSRNLLAYVLWSAIFEGKAEVGGFSLGEMLAYYILCGLLSQMDMSAGTGAEIAARIRGGTFSSYMTRPMSLYGFFAAQTAGTSAFYLSFNLLAAAAWALLFGVRVALAVNPVTVLGAVAMLLMGLMFMQSLNYFIGILAFKFVEVYMFRMIMTTLSQFATGALLPLALLPAGALAVMRVLPFYYVSYLPAMLFMGRLEGEMATGLLVLGAWNLFMFAVCRAAYARLRVRYDGVNV